MEGGEKKGGLKDVVGVRMISTPEKGWGSEGKEVREKKGGEDGTERVSEKSREKFGRCFLTLEGGGETGVGKGESGGKQFGGTDMQWPRGKGGWEAGGW